MWKRFFRKPLEIIIYFLEGGGQSFTKQVWEVLLEEFVIFFLCLVKPDINLLQMAHYTRVISFCDDDHSCVSSCHPWFDHRELSFVGEVVKANCISVG